MISKDELFLLVSLRKEWDSEFELLHKELWSYVIYYGKDLQSNKLF